MLNQRLEGDRAGLRSTGHRVREPLIAGLAVLALLGIGGFFYWHRVHPMRVASAPVVVQATPAKSPGALSPAEQEEQRAADALTASGSATDESLRARLGPLSPRAEWRAWLKATRDLIEGGAVIIANFSEDEDPRKRLQALAPATPFEVLQVDGWNQESPRSKHRFDVTTEVIDSIDPAALAPIWRGLHPLIAVAYRAVGHPGVSLDQAAGSALRRIENAPIQHGEPALERAGNLWIYSDPAFEKQGQIEKLLFRTGLKNELKLQAKAKAIRLALALP